MTLQTAKKLFIIELILVLFLILIPFQSITLVSMENVLKEIVLDYSQLEGIWYYNTYGNGIEQKEEMHIHKESNLFFGSNEDGSLTFKITPGSMNTYTGLLVLDGEKVDVNVTYSDGEEELLKFEILIGESENPTMYFFRQKRKN